MFNTTKNINAEKIEINMTAEERAKVIEAQIRAAKAVEAAANENKKTNKVMRWSFGVIVGTTIVGVGASIFKLFKDTAK